MAWPTRIVGGADADWAAPWGFTASCGWTRRASVWEDFTHATDELVLVLEGAMEFEVAGRAVRPAPGRGVVDPAAPSLGENVGARPRWLHGYRSGRQPGAGE